MANKLLSISLGSGASKLAEIVPNGRKVSVYSVYDLVLSDGLCEDGVILNADALAAELKSFMTSHAINCKKLVFVIASKRIASKEVVIPFVKEKQIQSIIQVNAPEYFPVSNIDEYALNYSILEIVQGETKQYRLSVTATPNELLKGYDELSKALKMPIHVMDYAGNAILQVLKSQTLTTDVTAILQLGRENTVINIMSSGILVMQRTVSNGLDAIVSAVREAFKLDEEEAYDFIVDNDINRICQAYPDVNDILMAMMMSISRIFEFYNTRAGEHHITSVKFVGDGTMINGIGSMIEQNLALPTEEIIRLFNVDIKGRSVTAEQATNFMSNIGAVLKPVGLKYTPIGEEGEKAGDEKLPIWAIIAAVVAAIVLVGSSLGLNLVSKVKIEGLRRQADALQPMRALETELNSKIELNSVVDGFYQSTKGANDSIHRLIVDLEDILPEGMSIDALSIDNGVVTINAGGIGKKSIAKVIMELKGLKYVDEVYVDYLSEVDDLLGKYDTFSISFTLADIHAIEFEEEQNAEDEASEESITFEDEAETFSEDEGFTEDTGEETESEIEVEVVDNEEGGEQ